MKKVSFVRKIDKLGRIMIPKKIRNILNFSENESLEIILEKEKLVLKKHQQACQFCNETENTIKYNKTLICKDCATEIAEKVK